MGVLSKLEQHPELVRHFIDRIENTIQNIIK